MLHELRSPVVSIVMPCYNHGKFIDEAVASIDRIQDKNIYEVVIVNDGSTDAYTIERLEALAKTGLYKIINQKNQGVCVAKNTALANARGAFILPVDADNRLLPEFIDVALAIFKQEPETMIVYSDYNIFGKETGIHKAGPFNLQRLMLVNYIDNCSMFRRELLDKIGNYDPNLTFTGAEDWELWLRAAFAGYKFHYAEQLLFDYRVVENSMIRRLIADKKKSNDNLDYFAQKHKAFFGPQYVEEIMLDKFRSNLFGYFFKVILKLYFPKVFAKRMQQGKFRKYL